MSEKTRQELNVAIANGLVLKARHIARRLHEEELDEAAAAKMIDLPDRIVVGKNGAYWRDYGDHYSMAVVSEDNDPIDPIAVYVRQRAS